MVQHLTMDSNIDYWIMYVEGDISLEELLKFLGGINR